MIMKGSIVKPLECSLKQHWIVKPHAHTHTHTDTQTHTQSLHTLQLWQRSKQLSFTPR